MKIKIHIIAPYESMVSVIKECIPLFPDLEIDYSTGDLVDGVHQAIEAEKDGAEIIISRGGTAQLIKKTVRIPVIDIQLSGYDMIRSLTLANDLESKTAIVGFSNITSGAQSIIDLLDFQLKVFTISDTDEVAPLILDLKNSGYQQIIGDVITIKTSAAYGLKGLLIQSGKEAIVASLEEAQFLYKHLNIKNDLSKIFEKFILKDVDNMMIMDEEDNVIYEHWAEFKSNPLSEEHLHLLHTNFEINNSKITGNFTVNHSVIDYTGYNFQIRQQSYKVIVLEKISISILDHKGITIHTDVAGELISATSASIKTIISHIETLYKNNEIILLQGDKGTGKDFITNYIHQKFSDRGMLLVIDFKEFDSKLLESIPLGNISTVKLMHVEYLEDNQTLTDFVESCLKYDVRLFIHTEDILDSNFIHEHQVNKIIMPNLSERIEDIRTLVQYFIAYYHQEYGTRAVKISDEALQLLENNTYPNNIDDLNNIIKQVTLNEKDYVVQKETIERILSDVNLSANAVMKKGTLKEIEKEIILIVLKEENNNQTKAAERLGISRATLWRKLKE